MTQFYQNKIKAIKKIDRMLEAGVSEDEINFKISEEFGFGKRFVRERIEAVEKFVKKQNSGKAAEAVNGCL